MLYHCLPIFNMVAMNLMIVCLIEDADYQLAFHQKIWVMIMMLWCFRAVLFLAVSLIFQTVFVPCDVYIVEVPALHEREVGCDVDINNHTLIHNELFLRNYWSWFWNAVTQHWDDFQGWCDSPHSLTHTVYSFACDKRSTTSQWLLSWRAFWGEEPAEAEDWLYEMWRNGCVTFKNYT